jgi:threonine dehydrogenase-like Zn-dependent dehydrogenase
LKAVVMSDGKVAVRDIPEPALRRDQVMVRVRACGICGSDVRYLQGENPWSQHTLGVQKPNPKRMVPGHEVAGEIVEVGDPSHKARIGERVVMMVFRGDDTCFYCRRGLHNLCEHTQHLGHSAGWDRDRLNPGGMAERCPIWADHAYRLPDSVSFEEATLLDGAGVALNAIHKADDVAGEPVAVTGCGVVGLLVIQILKALGAGPVIGIDTADKSLALAQELGAEVIVDPRKSDPVEEVSKATGGVGAAVALDTVGADETLIQSLRMVRRAGTVVTLVVGMRDMALPLGAISGERALVSAANFRYADFPAVIGLMAEGRISGRPMVTHVLPLDEAPLAFEIAADKAKSGAIKVVLQP